MNNKGSSLFFGLAILWCLSLFLILSYQKIIKNEILVKKRIQNYLCHKFLIIKNKNIVESVTDINKTIIATNAFIAAAILFGQPELLPSFHKALKLLKKSQIFLILKFYIDISSSKKCKVSQVNFNQLINKNKLPYPLKPKRNLVGLIPNPIKWNIITHSLNKDLKNKFIIKTNIKFKGGLRSSIVTKTKEFGIKVNLLLNFSIF